MLTPHTWPIVLQLNTPYVSFQLWTPGFHPRCHTGPHPVSPARGKGRHPPTNSLSNTRSSVMTRCSGMDMATSPGARGRAGARKAEGHRVPGKAGLLVRQAGSKGDKAATGPGG